ncbi:hypothetical protein [Gluconobacter sphaericus]|uniref:hypothetical protein n=1 Tax=Gluconobacter sphaericus TaxID=574987 RepID=UPI001B8B6171|nr:hypothetical protein [Gluconobacter sphaericus]MBS1087160.1 hypothetical protein [Gluconobacter sphaericus]MBS1101188.1 hypothetical protein [Gluconobacter sphaericus]
MTFGRVWKGFASFRGHAIGVIRLRIAPIARFVSGSNALQEIYASPLRLVLWGGGCLSLLGGACTRVLFGPSLGVAAFPVGAFGVLPISCVGLYLFVYFEAHAGLFWSVVGLTVLAIFVPLAEPLFFGR